jgi:glycosyltransferase involved in cell wall biosynthesis
MVLNNNNAKIVFPLLNLNKSGGTRIALQYCEELSNLNYNVVLITKKDINQNIFPIPHGISIKYVNVKFYKYFGYISYFFSFYKAFNKNDILVATSWQAYFITLFNLHPFDKTLLLIQHDDDIILSNKYSLKRLLFRIVYNLPIQKISVSEWLSIHLKKKYNINTFPISNGINIGNHSEINLLSQKKENSYFDVMTIARSVKWKGFADFVAAIEIANKHIPNLRMIIVSSENITINLNLPYLYFKPINDDELNLLYSNSDCFVFSSWIEGFGLPPLEAMANGTPVITTRCGGVLDFAKDRINCLLVDVKCPQQIAQAILELKENIELKNNLIQNGYLTTNEFTIKASVARLDKFILKPIFTK